MNEARAPVEPDALGTFKAVVKTPENNAETPGNATEKVVMTLNEILR